MEMNAKQLQMLDTRQVADTVCPVPGCGAIRFAGQERTPTCMHDLDLHVDRRKPRPRLCVNAYDPATTPIPY